MQGTSLKETVEACLETMKADGEIPNDVIITGHDIEQNGAVISGNVYLSNNEYFFFEATLPTH